MNSLSAGATFTLDLPIVRYREPQLVAPDAQYRSALELLEAFRHRTGPQPRVVYLAVRKYKKSRLYCVYYKWRTLYYRHFGNGVILADVSRDFPEFKYIDSVRGAHRLSIDKYYKDWIHRDQIGYCVASPDSSIDGSLIYRDCPFLHPIPTNRILYAGYLTSLVEVILQQEMENSILRVPGTDHTVARQAVLNWLRIAERNVQGKRDFLGARDFKILPSLAEPVADALKSGSDSESEIELPRHTNEFSLILELHPHTKEFQIRLEDFCSPILSSESDFSDWIKVLDEPPQGPSQVSSDQNVYSVSRVVDDRFFGRRGLRYQGSQGF
ncbi:hypothetical protein QAD02_008095 [Eretmocerus hayati]|uniref:Uncharacterized protein n=1 Tax=Eretmocerus hayati TaxID=131215 RepID=A0ACC2N651_9HYME|nr:hypothetical protein QAD02_008095 [Eretmocerus hayati]